MSFRHPSGITVDVYGIAEPSRGRSCEHHEHCGSVVQIDTVLRFRAIQIINSKDEEETAMAAYWVTDGYDRCRVGFLPRYCLKHKIDFDGKLAQVSSLLSESANKAERNKSFRNRGVAVTSLIEVETDESASKRKYDDNEENTDNDNTDNNDNEDVGDVDDNNDLLINDNYVHANKKHKSSTSIN